MDPPTEESTVTMEMMCGLDELRIRHPPGTFALTPASLISLRAIGEHRTLLAGHGLDRGSGTGCLAIAAAQVPGVQNVVGLEISEANVAVARENARQNGVAGKVTFLLADSYLPLSPSDCSILDRLAGRVSFILANPPSSEDDDGFGYRRVVLQGARTYLASEGVVFLSVSYQYGQERVERLCQDAPGFVYRGVLTSTDWVPFDLSRPALLHCLHLYAEEERRGGLEYTFRHPEAPDEERMNAVAALAHYQRTGKSPLSKWQTHCFVFRASSPGKGFVGEKVISEEIELVTKAPLTIRSYAVSDEAGVIRLWREVFPENPPWNEPRADIQRKLGCQRELFLVAESEGQVVATVMAGFDGHQGWVHLVAVAPDWQRRGIGRAIMSEAEKRLRQVGCTKVNLQVRASNRGVGAFYEKLGYAVEERISMGKRLT